MENFKQQSVNIVKALLVQKLQEEQAIWNDICSPVLDGLQRSGAAATAIFTSQFICWEEFEFRSKQVSWIAYQGFSLQPLLLFIDKQYKL